MTLQSFSLMLYRWTGMCLDMDFFLFILHGICWRSESEDWYLASQLENAQPFFSLYIGFSPFFLFTVECQ